MLGAHQHGHMTDVGYDMYMKLLGQAVSEARGEKIKPVDSDCVIDIQEDAHLPEDYISNLSHRLEMYRRIADIKNSEDAGDVIDEMIDRFGDPPEDAGALVNVALIRSKAQTMGVTAIRQTGDQLRIFFREIRCEGAADIMENSVRQGYRANLDMSGKPHISVAVKSGETPTEALKHILDLNN